MNLPAPWFYTNLDRINWINPTPSPRPEDELGAWTVEIRGHQVHFDVFSGLDPALGRWAVRKPNSRYQQMLF